MIVINNYIIAIQKSDPNYAELHELIVNRPTDAPGGYTYMLNATTLEWELVELPPTPEPEPDAEISDYEQQLADLGVRFE